MLGFVNYDKNIAGLNLAGRPIGELSADSAVLESVKQRVKKIMTEDKV
ncbi:MAG: hypothetical protein IJB78_06435 [Oscillospiraceae bacterium]|nr:hypothetical protein [Oscillospiraceae bacterium]